jgi:FMN phosphatase YigB (HAD superfamily)
MTEIFSFDVFDTALLRRVAAPSDIFRFVARRIAKESVSEDHSHFVEHFVSARIVAEQKARSLSATEDCTLDDIWIVLRSMLPSVCYKFGPEDELEIEHQFLAPNTQLAARISALRAKHHRIIFISDTYLPQEFVRNELIRYGLAESGDGIYVSSAIGLTKQSGNLFRYVTMHEKIDPSKLFHLGDNFFSDVKMSSKIGIRSELYRGTQLNKWETVVVSETSISIPAEIASILAGSMRIYRLRANSECGSVNSLTAAFLGPLLSLWAAWVLGSAQKDGVRRLYFAARDCYLLFEAAKALAPHFNNIECRYLAVSRQTLLLASVTKIDQSEMSWVTQENPTVRQAAERVGLNWEEVAEVFAPAWQGNGSSKRLCTHEDWEEFWNLLRIPRLDSLVIRRARKSRARTVAYLKQEGLFDNVSAGFVDLGWLLNQQRALLKLLNDGDQNHPIRGYYFGLMLDRVSLAETGDTKAIFYQASPDRRTSTQDLFARRLILEKILKLAPHGTICGYELDGDRWIALSDEVPSETLEVIRQTKEAIREFCTELQSEVVCCVDEVVARELIEKLSRAWFAAPDLSAIGLLTEANTDDKRLNPLPDIDQRLVDPWGLLEAIQYLVPGRFQSRFRISIRGRFWPEASLLRTAWLPATLVHLRDRRLQKAWHMGKGFAVKIASKISSLSAPRSY